MRPHRPSKNRALICARSLPGQTEIRPQNSLRNGNSNGPLAGDEDVQIVDLGWQLAYNTRTTSHCAGRTTWDISFLAIK